MVKSYTPLENAKKSSDLVKWETDQRFCRAVGTYTNGTGSPVTIDPVGVPVVYTVATGVIVLVMTTADATANAVIIDNDGEVIIPDGESQEFICLVRGPALINKDALAATDVDGAALVNATLVTALADENIQVLDEASPESEQTT